TGVLLAVFLPARLVRLAGHHHRGALAQVLGDVLGELVPRGARPERGVDVLPLVAVLATPGGDDGEAGNRLGLLGELELGISGHAAVQGDGGRHMSGVLSGGGLPAGSGSETGDGLPRPFAFAAPGEADRPIPLVAGATPRLYVDRLDRLARLGLVGGGDTEPELGPAQQQAGADRANRTVLALLAVAGVGFDDHRAVGRGAGLVEHVDGQAGGALFVDVARVQAVERADEQQVGLVGGDPFQ